MIVTEHMNIDPFKVFMGKVVEGYDTEWYLVDHFDLFNLGNILDKYYMYVNDKITLGPNYEQLFHIVSVLKTALVRKTPPSYSILKNIKILKREKVNGRYRIEIIYEFE